MVSDMPSKNAYDLVRPDRADKEALWVYLGFDFAFVAIAYLAFGPEVRKAIAFYAPLLLLILNGIVAVVVCRSSYDKIQTSLLGSCLGIIVGMAAGYAYFSHVLSVSNSDQDSVFMARGLQLGVSAIPALCVLGLYISRRNMNR